MSHFLSEISGVKSNWLKVNPSKVMLIGEDKLESGSDDSTVLKAEAVILFY
jgi:hypothetical protein